MGAVEGVAVVVVVVVDADVDADAACVCVSLHCGGQRVIWLCWQRDVVVERCRCSPSCIVNVHSS